MPIYEAAGDPGRARDLVDLRLLHAALIEERARCDHEVEFAIHASNVPRE